MSCIETAIRLGGGPAKVAALLQVSNQAVCFWRDEKREFPVRYAAQLEEACGFAVRRWHFRPDDWHRIWPELIGAEGAPPVREEKVA